MVDESMKSSLEQGTGLGTLKDSLESIKSRKMFAEDYCGQKVVSAIKVSHKMGELGILEAISIITCFTKEDQTELRKLSIRGNEKGPLEINVASLFVNYEINKLVEQVKDALSLCSHNGGISDNDCNLDG